MDKPSIEELLRKIQVLEAGHAELKGEMSKLLLPETLMSGDSASRSSDSVCAHYSVLPEEEAGSSRLGGAIDGGVDAGGGDVDAGGGIDYSASWKKLSTLIEYPHSPFAGGRWSGGGRGAGTRFISPVDKLPDAHYLNILQSMGQAIHVMDVDDRLIYWNRPAERLYGYTAEEALNVDVFQLLVDEKYHDLGNKIVAQVKRGESWTGLFPIRSKKGKCFSIVVTDCPLYDEDGTLIGVACIGSDMRPFQNNTLSLPDARDSGMDVGFSRVRNSVSAKLGLDPELPVQAAIATRITGLATKVSNKVRSKMKNGKNIEELEIESTDSCPTCPSSFGSQTEKFSSNLSIDWGEETGERTDTQNITSKAGAWISKKAKKWPWKRNEPEFSEAGVNHFGSSWLQGEDIKDPSSPPMKSEIQDKEYNPPVVAETSESCFSSITANSTSGFGSSSTSSSSTKKLEILTGCLDYEVFWEDLVFEEQIGQGSCGTVYHGLWCGSDVAIKVFTKVEYSEEIILAFGQEVSLMKSLRHPNILLFMGAVTSPPHLCIITEFFPRGSLFHLLQRKAYKLDWKRRINMAIDIARGMNYLHHCTPPIVHRDLKSSNLLVDMNWNVKVADFGLSRIKHETYLTTKSGKGTPQWMAPEVLRHEPSDEKSDLYSFGVVLWELATGKFPWENLNSMQVIGAVGFKNQRLEIPSDVDPRWAALIEGCWQSCGQFLLHSFSILSTCSGQEWDFTSEPQARPSFKDLLRRLKDLAREHAAQSKRPEGVRDQARGQRHFQNGNGEITSIRPSEPDLCI